VYDVQFVLLASLVWSGKKPLTQKQLAVFTKTDVMMTSQVVRKLEQKGLLTRESSSDDARSFLLQPTPGGITLANKAVRAVEEVDTHFFGILGDDLVDFVTEIQLLAEQD
jgi:DNA-binding MarR family transcriptional regulator